MRIKSLLYVLIIYAIYYIIQSLFLFAWKWQIIVIPPTARISAPHFAKNDNINKLLSFYSRIS